jgi:hypothetical protein
MANKRVTSAPLFGRASNKEVKDIQESMDAYTARLLKNAEAAREVLRRTGAAAADKPK